MGKNSTQSTSTTPDANSQQYQQLWRQTLAGTLGGLTGNNALQQYAGQYGTNLGLPDLNSLISATQADYAKSGQQGVNAANAYATGQGAYGGTRQAIAAQTALSQNAQNENSALANIRYQANQAQFNRIAQILGLMQGGANIGGYSTTQEMQGNGLAGGLGAAVTLGSLLFPPAAAAGAGAGAALAPW